MYEKKKKYQYIFTRDLCDLRDLFVGKPPKHKRSVTPYPFDVGVGKFENFHLRCPESRAQPLSLARGFSRPRRATLSTERVKFTVIKIITRGPSQNRTGARA